MANARFTLNAVEIANASENQDIDNIFSLKKQSGCALIRSYKASRHAPAPGGTALSARKI